MEKDTPKRQTLASEYENMKQDRQPYLEKAKLAAKYTIPSLISDNTKKYNGIKQIETPNQSVGADGINNLSSKVTLTMLPPNQTFFKFSMDDLVIKEQAELSGITVSQYQMELNKGLSRVEKMLLDYQEQLSDRVCTGEAIKHLYVAGNVFLVHDPKEGLKYYPLDRFCVKRDYCGNVIKAITEETITLYSLPEEIQELVLMKVLERKAKEKDINRRLEEEELTLYTVFRRKV